MSAPQWIGYEKGGTIHVDVAALPTGTPTVSVYNDAGGTIVDAANATASTIDTTLSAAAAKGARTISVTSATGIANRSRILLKDVLEEVLVKSVSGTTVTLRRPLVEDHANGSDVEGGRITYAVSADDADDLFWRGSAVWTVDSVEYRTGVECTKYPLRRQATMVDVWAAHTRADQYIPAEVDPEEALDQAHEDVLTDIAARDAARVFTASGEQFRRAVAFTFWRNIYMDQASDRAIVLFDRFSQAADNEVGKICSITARDANQDGKVDASDAFPSSRTRRLRLS